MLKINKKVYTEGYAQAILDMLVKQGVSQTHVVDDLTYYLTELMSEYWVAQHQKTIDQVLQRYYSIIQ